jgi:hypothetical protein
MAFGCFVIPRDVVAGVTTSWQRHLEMIKDSTSIFILRLTKRTKRLAILVCVLSPNSHMKQAACPADTYANTASSLSLLGHAWPGICL